MDYQFLWVELDKVDTGSETNIIVGVVYRRPGSDISTFNDTLSDTLTIIKNEKKESLHSGDYNLDLLKPDSHNPTNDFILTNFTHSFIPQINKPTRVMSSTATIINNIFTNTIHDAETTNGILITDISDHFPIIYIKHAKSDTPTPNTEFKLKRLINQFTRAKFTQEIRQTDWSDILNDSNAQNSYTKFHDHLSQTFDKCFP